MLYLLTAVLLFCCAHDAGAAILHVGTHWSGTQYSTIQGGVDNATDGDEIWVEQGTYNLSSAITVSKAVFLYGGFTGSETERDQRNWADNVTTVDGQNTVGCFYTTADTTIDGFTITRGYKNTGGTDAEKGAGILNGDLLLGSPPADAPDLTVANCILYRNESYLKSGGAICNFTSAGNLTIKSCTFEENFGDEQGGAIRVQKGNIIIEDSVFKNNKIKKDTGGVGGAVAISNTAGPASIARCTFTGNKCKDAGALGIDVQATITRCIFANNNPVIAAPRYGTIASRGDLPLTITNCLFYGNRVQYGGGICINSTGTNENLTVTNCTFSGNTLVGATTGGGSIYSQKTLGTFTITNSILWRNAAVKNKEIGGDTGYLTPTVSYSDIDNTTVYAGSNGNIMSDPLFVGSGDYHLQETSPCINTGTSTGAPSVDIEETARPQGAGYDMGAYEYHTACVGPYLSAPIGAGYTPKPTFTWKQTGSADWYNVVVWSEAANSGSSMWVGPAACTAGTCSATFPHPLALGNNWWWLNIYYGENSCGLVQQPGGTGLVKAFTVVPCAGPTLTSPNGDAFAPGTKPTFTFNQGEAEWIAVLVWTSAGYLALNQWEDAAVKCSSGTCTVVSNASFPAGTTNWWWLNTYSAACGFQMQPGGLWKSFTVTP